MASINVDVIDNGVTAKIRAMVAAGENLQPLHERIGAGLLSNIRLGFKAGSSPYGQPWAPLKIRQGQPLRDTGRLQNSITPAADATGVTIGTNVRYAAIHQFGGTIRPKAGPFLVFPIGGGRFARKKQVTIPARPFMPLDDTGAPNLPPGYQKTVINRIRAHFTIAAKES